MIAPMQKTLGIFTRCGTSPSAVARIRITTPNGPVRMMQRMIINTITAWFSNLPSIPLNLLAERDNHHSNTISSAGSKNADNGQFTHSG